MIQGPSTRGRHCAGTRRAPRLLLAGALLVTAGCGAGSQVPAGSTGETAAGLKDPGALFAGAQPLYVGEGVTEIVTGEIADSFSVDVYDIGPLRAGERLTVLASPHGELNPVLGLFDAEGDSLMINDDRDFYGGDLSSRVSLQSRRDSPACYVAVAASYRSGSRGGYTLTVNRPGVEPLAPAAAQVVYLQFEGAAGVVIGRREPVAIPPFDAAQITPALGGRTEELVAAIAARLWSNYDGLRVEFLSSRDGPKPATPCTTIYFGAYESGLLGIADYVDEFNAALEQKAIVYVDAFKSFMYLGPTLEQLAAALAGVAAHELGHLLGLNHSADARDLMGVSATAQQMFAGQTFNRTPLHPEVFPIGFQNSARLLVEAVGGDLPVSGLRPKLVLPGDAAGPARRPDRPLSDCFGAPGARHPCH